MTQCRLARCDANPGIDLANSTPISNAELPTTLPYTFTQDYTTNLLINGTNTAEKCEYTCVNGYRLSNTNCTPVASTIPETVRLSRIRKAGCGFKNASVTTPTDCFSTSIAASVPTGWSSHDAYDQSGFSAGFAKILKNSEANTVALYWTVFGYNSNKI